MNGFWGHCGDRDREKDNAFLSVTVFVPTSGDRLVCGQAFALRTLLVCLITFGRAFGPGKGGFSAWGGLCGGASRVKQDCNRALA